MNNELERIKSIKSFPSLVKYLREELDWKIEDEDIEDLTFEYEPDELDIDKATAVKIKEIKQLRPMVSNQPWGIFYLSFEPKRLPVVALRRILRSLVLKKRASANRSQMATWNQNDLLFISSYGEDSSRELTFAHFSDNTGIGDLPTLKVLGWNAGNTVLRLQDTYQTLKEKLRWVDDETDVEAWRKQWSSAFKLEYRQTIKTSKELAIKLADLAIIIRERVNEVLAIESEKGELRKLYKAFQEALIHDLSEDDFADMYAQTIAYGLLSARISRASGALVADNIADMIPITNPFLKELMQTFLTVGGRKSRIDFDELGINEVVELLRQADMEEVKKDFGAKNPNEDPVIHFYELFLKEYDPEKRMKRGVFYTPRPVVSFIVRSVHEILQKEFGLEDGLADRTTWGEMKARNKGLEIPAGVKETAPFVQILDPATGTGTFLVEVVNVIYETLREKWQRAGNSMSEQAEAWNDYVPKHLLPRLFGFELMMAPYSIAHMKIGLKLSETGYRFLSSERAQIYLTNTLEEPKDFSDYFATMSPALAHEAEASNRVKRNTPITVVVGNPPYSNFGMLNKNIWISSLLESYKAGLNEQKINLDDDFIKFICVSQWYIQKTGLGLIGFITNNTQIDGITHRQMRYDLLKTFSDIKIVDLHGSVKKNEKDVDGSKDENVFDIQQGVAISLMTCPPKTQDGFLVSHSDLRGTRQNKYRLLLDKTSEIEFRNFTPDAPNYFFVPSNYTQETKLEWDLYPSLISLFKIYSSGVKTHLDSVLVGHTDKEIKNDVENFISEHWQNIPAKNAPRASALRKSILLKDSLNKGNNDFNISNYAYRVFDTRKTAYLIDAIEAGDHRYAVMKHVIAGSISLIATRQLSQGNFSHIFVSREISDMCLLSTSTKECAYCFPLHLKASDEQNLLTTLNVGKSLNFSDEFIEEFSDKLRLSFSPESKVQSPKSVSEFTPEDVFHYAYAVFHSPTYRARYAEFLKIDFPRLPLTTDRELFRKLCAPGEALVRAHLLEAIDAPADWNLKTTGASLSQNAEVAAGFPKWEDGKVFINKTTFFAGVPETVWQFHIGGYQVCHKWLKDRKGRTLSADDIKHYGKIAVALSATIRLMAEIDETIEEHGGFPLAGSLDAAPSKKRAANALPFD